MYAFCTTSHVILYKYETLQDFAINHVFFFFFFFLQVSLLLINLISNIKITSLSNRNELIYRRFDDIIFRIKKFEEAFRFITKKIKAKVKIRFRTLVAYDRYKFSKELQTVTKNNVLFVLIERAQSKIVDK